MGESNPTAATVNDTATTVLLVSADLDDARQVREALTGHARAAWRVRRLRRLRDALDRLKKGGIDVVLLDLSLPDSQGITTFETLHEAAPLIPILVLASGADEALALQATRRGALDYLLREHLDMYWLPRLLHSVIERKAAEDALFLEQERAQVTLNSIGDAVLSTDIADNITYLNKVAEQMTGWRCEEAVGRPLAEVFRIIDGTTREPVPNPMLKAVEKDQTVTLEANCILLRRDGTECPIEDSAAPIRDRLGQVTGAVIVFREIGMARTVVEKMAHMAQHDALTGLPNRLLIDDRVTSAIALARRHRRQCAVLFLDLDGFKEFNDARGHALGDKLLRLVAKRLRGCVRDSDTVGRQGGDEFVVLLAEIGCVADAARSAEKLLSALAAPHTIAGKSFRFTASIGIGVYPGDGNSAESLLRSADKAMYRAKERGRNNYRFFREEMNAADAGRERTAAAAGLP